MKRLLLTTSIIAVFAFGIVAQTSSDDKNEASIWGGFSPDSMTALKFAGNVPDARFGLVAFRYARRLKDGKDLKIRWTIDAIPAAFLSYPDVGLSGMPPTFHAIRENRYAWGFTPLGAQFSFRNHKKYQPFVDISAGLLFFRHITPNFGDTKLNFTPNVGGGLEIVRPDGRSFTIGYKAFHISNANRGTSNPGFQNNLIYVGYKFHSW
ncbi:MAG: acyloxyacyl hydrolase [Acidobacteria bacterium]|nr:acyloxyacyl hydrolase [Acidobacteriota bacterium]